MRRPEALGYEVVRSCSEGLCEEGMHVGGLYCCSGQGYTGRYLNGTIDELRIWTRSLTGIELNSKMRTPLAAGDEEGLLFYFPLDEAGMETGANVIESRALPWYAMLGNAAGSGRPSWVVSDAPLACSSNSHAPICQRIASGDDGFAATVGGVAAARSAANAFSGLDEDEDSVSISAYLLLLFFASIASAALAAVLTYTGIKGEPPPIVTDAGEIPAAIVRRLHDGLQSLINSAQAGGYAAGVGGSFTASPNVASPPAARDWTWAQPPRPGQEQQPAPAPAASSYGGV